MTDRNSPPSGPDPHDEGLAALYRQAPRGEPPARQDAAILAAAAAELTAPRTAPRPPWWLRWRLGLSVAATLVLTTSLVLLVQREQGAAPEQARKATAERPAPARQEAAAPPAPTRQEAAGPSAPAASPPTVKAESEPRPPAPAAPAVGAEAPAPAAAGARRKEATLEQQAFPAAPASALSGEARSGEARSDTAAPPHDAATAAPAPAPPAAAAPAEARPSLGRSAAEPAREATPLPPEAWLEDIRKLHRAGRDGEAREALAAFRRSYPDHPLPADLATLQASP